jgi:F-type H+-transporting ATPase subunit gamma
LASKGDLRRRIRSVKSTQQITKAMKMVAAARLRRAQQKIIEARPYAAALSSVLRTLAAQVNPRRHPLLAERPEKTATVIVVTGDKGLCGAFNTNVLRQCANLLASGRWEKVELVVAGRKGIDYFRVRGREVLASYPDLMHTVTPEKAAALVAWLTERFTSGATDAVYLVYNSFRSVIQQRIEVERLLPVERESFEGGAAPVGYLYEPSPVALLNQILPRHVSFQVLRVLLDSQAAEHAARMTAMDSASKNAAEMIERLTLTYNRVRQTTITKELIEIVSGAQALAER